MDVVNTPFAFRRGPYLVVVLASATLGLPGVLSAATHTRVSVASDGTPGDGHSFWPAMSADGRYIAFVSEASNLVAADTNGVSDVFVHDRQTGQTERVSVSSNGEQAVPVK